MGIKVATLDDLNVVVDFVTREIEESPYKDFPVSRNKVINISREFIVTDNSQKIVILSYAGTTPVGILAASIDELPFNTTKVASEIVYYVLPEHRRGKHAVILSHAFEEWGRMVGCDLAQHAVMSTTPESLTRFYERKGYTPVERAFIKEL